MDIPTIMYTYTHHTMKIVRAKTQIETTIVATGVERRVNVKETIRHCKDLAMGMSSTPKFVGFG